MKAQMSQVEELLVIRMYIPALPHISKGLGFEAINEFFGTHLVT